MKLVVVALVLLWTTVVEAQPPTGGSATTAATQQYSLSVTKAGAGTGTVTGAGPINCGTTCSASYVSGTTTRLTATPSAGSSFSGWSGACVGTGMCNVTINSDKTVTATFAAVSSSANRFAKMSGLRSGSCGSAPAACDLDYVLSIMVCGDTLQIQNGTYTGSSNMLIVNNTTAPNAINCSSNRVTVQAETEGSVLFDRQHAGASARAVWIRRVNGWTIQGINARNGAGVIEIGYWSDPATDTNDIILQRAIGWEATNGLPGGSGNLQVLLVTSSTNTLIEDVGAFGTAVETCLDFGNIALARWHRVWCRAEGSTYDSGSPIDGANPVQFNYTGSDHPTPSLIENVIMTSGVPRGSTSINNYGTNWVRHSALSPYLRVYGGIHYAETGAAISNQLTNDGGYCGYILQDNLIHFQLGNPANKEPLRLRLCEAGDPTRLQQTTRTTSIKLAAASGSVTNSATMTNFIENNSVAATGFDYLGTGNTARLCYEYNNGTYTSTPLWPWRMDDRIKAAIALNTVANGAHTSASVALTGSGGTGYNPNTVTSEIVSLFGSIPTSCNRSALFRERTGPNIAGLIFLLIAGAAYLHQRRQDAIRSRA